MLVNKIPQFLSDQAFVRSMDENDPMRDFRNRFYIPQMDGKDVIYFTGNSLGLQPKTVRTYIETELLDWQNLAVEGHLHARNPWLYYHHFLEEKTARLAGASVQEVVVMNTLTVNLNLMMISFYRPTKQRYKILMEYMAFPSDQYAVVNQVKFHGFDPHDAIIEVCPREGESVIRTEDILAEIEKNKDSLALVMIGGVNYYSGQFFDIKTITDAAHKAGAVAGFDLAHAAGNIPLYLHDWNIDFGIWCSYKYLNSGPGGTSGVFIHERHCNDNTLPRLSGWWGNDEKTRFKMQKGFIPQPGAAGWQMSNAQILPMAAHRASLEIFDEAGMENLRVKSILLTGYLEYLLLNGKRKDFSIITPSDPEQRGCQLSIVMNENGKKTFDLLTERNVIADWREPDVIRVAPVPLYNTFDDVYRFAEIFHQV